MWVNPAISVVEYLNCISFTISVTVNDPLKPRLNSPVVVSLLSSIPLTITMSSTLSLWGVSVVIVTVDPDREQFATNFWFLLYLVSSKVNVDFKEPKISVSLSAPV